MKTLLERFKARTPERDKKLGKFATKIGTGAAAAFALIPALGITCPPIAMLALGVIAAVFGSKAVWHGLQTEIKTDPKNKEDEQN
jgi:hypothetical protein